MASYQHDNGKNGMEKCCHTATGYQCVARHAGNTAEHYDRVMFVARHVVGSDGRPYTEIGLTGLEEYEKADTLREVKQELRRAHCREVLCLSEVESDEFAFSEQVSPDPTSVMVRVNAGKKGISIVAEILGRMVLDSSRRFIVEQEEVEDVLFHSILDVLGPELDKGPGGHQHALEKAHELAHEFTYGFRIEAPKGYMG